MKLKGKKAIVTGSGQGIGRGIALAFAREGADVIVADINSETLRKTVRELESLGVQSLAVRTDVTKSRDVRNLIKETLKKFGRIDILVNNAGIAIKAPIEEYSERDWDKTINLNLKGVFLCSQTAGKYMIKQRGGNIINIASIAGHMPEVLLGAYSPSKAGVIALTGVLAMEWSKYNIRVNAISPGPILTPALKATYADKKALTTRRNAIPMNRFGTTQDIGKAAVFLASDDSDYITGHTLVVDGGSLKCMYWLLSTANGSLALR